MEKAINRQRVLLDHLRPSSSSHNFESTLSASACLAGDSAAYQRTSAYGDDVVIVAAYRTPQCKSKRGGFKDTHADDLLAPVLKALIEKTNLGPREVGDIVVGSELAPGSQRASECRMAAFYAGSPETVPIRTVNRQCSSGLQAVADVAASIKAGFYEIGIGAGLESMTINQMSWDGDVNPKLKNFQKAQDCLLPMGITSENVAHRFGVTRQEQDQAAVDSHRKAAAATASGRFKDEIIPVATKIVDPKTGDEKPIVVSVDDGIRPETSVAGLGKLKTVFKKDGTTTAGNSSQISDGAGAVLLMKRSVAVQKGLPILGVFRTFAAVGVDPAIMGVGPAVAIPAAVKAAGLELEDIDLVEVNEMDYINTSHPNFIGGSKAVENAQQQIKSSKGSLAMPRQKGVRPVAEVEKVPPAGNTNVSSWGISSIFGGGDHSRMYAKENSTSKSYNELAQCIEPLEQSLSLIHLREPPTVLRPSENHSEHESIEIVVTKLLLRSYFDIVRKNIEDSIPKAIMHFLVNHTKRELHNVFIRKLYRENLFEEMLQEPDEIAMKRKQTREQLRVLQQAFRTLDELPLEAETVERGYSLSSDSTGLPKIHGLPTSTMYSSGSSDSYTASPKNPKSRKSSHSGELQPHLYADSNGSGHAYMPGLYPTVDF